MENPSHAPLGGLDPADLLKQGAAEDTFTDVAASSFNPPPIEELTAIFPQFEILELIGKGGMGAVYKVRQKDLDRIVALKILPPGSGQSREFSNRFTREARALAKLNHPGIVTLHEFGQQDGLYFILMEFVDGVNLAQLMKTGRISPREALAIVPQICDALQFAHDQGIVHRDIKPENILLDRLGRVKVADFGIAKVVAAVCEDPLRSGDTPVPTDQTLAGKIIGTPQYMAPEQIEHPAEVDHRADIYALGVVFYQMLTGELPGKRLEAPSKKVHIDVRLDEIVLRAMEKEPEMRYQTAHEFRTVVDGVQAQAHARTCFDPVPEPANGVIGEARVDSFAITSLVLAISSFVLVGPLGSLPAVIFGHISLSRIKTNPLMTGRGFAIGGLIFGYLNLLMCVVALLFYLSLKEWVSKDPMFSIPPPRALIIEEPTFPSPGSSVNHPLLMTEFGEFKSEQSPWTIHVSAKDRTLQISRQPGSNGIGTSISPEKWRAQNGWFAFIEDETHAWAYDGDKKLMLVEVTPEKSTLYDTETIPRRVPKAIMSRITLSTREMIGTKTDKKQGEKARAIVQATAGTPSLATLPRRNHEQVFAPYSPDKVILASLEPSCFIADVPEGFELTSQNALAESLRKNPDVDIHDDLQSRGMTGMTLRQHDSWGKSTQQNKPQFARIDFSSKFRDKTVHFRGEIKEGDNQRLTEIQASLALDQRIVIKLGSGPEKRLRYLVLWFSYSTHHAKKSPEQMDKDREHALEWLGLLDGGDYSKASEATMQYGNPGFGLDQEEWNAVLTEIRKPRGAVISRVFKTSLEPGSLVGAPSGIYRLMQFETEFSDGTKTVESVTFIKDRDYIWKVVAYFIDSVSGSDAQVAVRLGGAEVGVLAEIWIVGIDAGKYSQSWKDAAKFFQSALTENGWVSALEGMRKPLGAVKSRVIRDKKKATALPDAPDGEYLIIQFDTSFTAKAEAVETVTFMLEQDGSWRAAGYFIR